jgi:hypothetical protein
LRSKFRRYGISSDTPQLYWNKHKGILVGRLILTILTQITCNVQLIKCNIFLEFKTLGYDRSMAYGTMKQNATQCLLYMLFYFQVVVYKGNFERLQKSSTASNYHTLPQAPEE